MSLDGWEGSNRANKSGWIAKIVESTEEERNYGNKATLQTDRDCHTRFTKSVKGKEVGKYMLAIAAACHSAVSGQMMH